MRTITLMFLLGVLLLAAGCCETYSDYGRYTLKIDCDKVNIGGVEYDVTELGGNIVIDGHTVSRGIDRKTEPWLYLHRVTSDSVEVTFEDGGKDIYPLYTGAAYTIFDAFSGPWNIAQSTNFQFDDDYWLVAHIWTTDGVLFDLQKNLGDEYTWDLEQEDILVPNDGSLVTITEINATVEITAFDAVNKTATVVFTSL